MKRRGTETKVVHKPELVPMLVGLIEATKDSAVIWEAEVHGDDSPARTLACQLGDGYLARLNRFAVGQEPDFDLTLFHDDTKVVEVNRHSVDAEELQEHAPAWLDGSSGASFSYVFFVELWQLAEANAERKSGHLAKVTRLLDQRRANRTKP